MYTEVHCDLYIGGGRYFWLGGGTHPSILSVWWRCGFAWVSNMWLSCAITFQNTTKIYLEDQPGNMYIDRSVLNNYGKFKYEILPNKSRLCTFVLWRPGGTALRFQLQGTCAPSSSPPPSAPPPLHMLYNMDFDCQVCMHKHLANIQCTCAQCAWHTKGMTRPTNTDTHVCVLGYNCLIAVVVVTAVLFMLTLSHLTKLNITTSTVVHVHLTHIPL